AQGLAAALSSPDIVLESALSAVRARVKRDTSSSALHISSRRASSALSQSRGTGTRRRKRVAPPLVVSKVSQPCSKPPRRCVPADGTVVHTRQLNPSESTNSRY